MEYSKRQKPSRPSNIIGYCCIIAGILIFAASFLNFGLALVFGLVGTCFTFIRTRTLFFKIAFSICYPSMLILALTLFPATREFANLTIKDPLNWNYGIPLLILQPLLIITVATDTNREKSVKAD